jgi:putative tryptophan/tyrosine transport system substrate-binding protein
MAGIRWCNERHNFQPENVIFFFVPDGVLGVGKAMRRREFVTFLTGAAAIWPLTARAQQSMPVIGWLSSVSAEVSEPNLWAFRKALADTGYVEGHNLQIEYRWADGKYDRLPAMAADLVGQRVTLIVASGAEPAAFAAKAATATIPIVMTMGSDPVKQGLVASLNRPGANATGATVYSFNMESKRLGLLHEAVPAAKTIAVLVNPASPGAESQTREVQEAAPGLGVEVVIFNAHDADEFESLFAAMAERKVAALLVTADPSFNSQRGRLIALAARYRLPAIYEWRVHAVEGGLMSYGTVLTDAFSQVGNYAGRILNGEKPADLPVVLPTNFQFVINLKTAKALGLEIPPTLSARADEVIE